MGAEGCGGEGLRQFVIALCRSCRRLRSFDLDLKIKVKRSQPSAAPARGTFSVSRSVFQFGMFKVVWEIQKLPTMFSGCPSDVSSLACVGRCQFSDRDWNPGERVSAKASFMTYACPPSWCAVCYGGCARETFESAGFLRSPGSNLRTAATPSRGTEWSSFIVQKEKQHEKANTQSA